MGTTQVSFDIVVVEYKIIINKHLDCQLFTCKQHLHFLVLIYYIGNVYITQHEVNVYTKDFPYYSGFELKI